MSSVRVGRRRSAILPTLVIVAILVVAFAIFTSVWTDRLWYRSFDFGAVFTTMLTTRIGLFIAFGLIMLVVTSLTVVIGVVIMFLTSWALALIFLAPPSREDLKTRLVGRGTDDEETIKRRLAHADEELAAEKEFDRTVVNDFVERAADELVGLLGSLSLTPAQPHLSG